ncbi:MAG: hypothetical protein HQ518_15225 [Rhodopirellula sp.]|jgi:hypothetical protein|nr:hypothetical protein [Rhodopirellula sp.]
MTDRVSDDEIIYRRVPARPQWCIPGDPVQITVDAFSPLKSTKDRLGDVDGLSVTRAKSSANPSFATPADVAGAGPSPAGYFVLELRVSDLQKLGLSVVPDPKPDNPGHALIPEIHEAVRKQAATKALQNSLVQNVQAIYGRFVRNEKGELVNAEYPPE